MFSKGYKQTEEHKNKIREALIGNKNGKNNKGKIVSEETRQKISKAQIGRKLSEECKNKIRLSHLGKKYKSMSREGRINIGKSALGRFLGEKHPYWRGGKSPQYRIRVAPRPKPEQCEVCGAFGKDSKKGICYDHDHETGKFRGWLCGRCNIALGLVKDNTETLMALVEYIKKSRQ